LPACGANCSANTDPPGRSSEEARGLEVDHLGIAVPELAAALEPYRRVFGLMGSAPEEVAGQRVRVSFVDVGNTQLEFLEPTEPDSPVGRFLTKRGPGLHHVAFRVKSVDAQLASVEAAGGRLIDRVARPGARGHRVGFAHPTAFGGVLVEFVEHA
jgi:methylmalonyl-CoA epimerase